MKRFTWITIALAMSVLFLLPVQAFAQPAPNELPKIAFSGKYEFISAAEDRLLELVNDLRQNPANYTLTDGTKVSTLYSGGRKPLAKSANIQSAARYKSLYMMGYNDYAHNYTKGPLAGVGSGSVSELIFYSYSSWAENIAAQYGYGTDSAKKIAEGLFKQWLNSTSHRNNMMNSSFTHIGIGVVGSKNSSGYPIYATEQFSSNNPSTLKHKMPSPLTTGGTQITPAPTAKPTQTPKPSPSPTSPRPNKTGWVKDGSNWKYMGSNGKYVTGWMKEGNTWYYMYSNGIMATGWVKVGNTWYYLKGSGAMATGWLKLGGTWYYLHGSGAMATGWLKLGNTWYYLRGSGAMATSWLYWGGKWYYLYPNGAMATGEVRMGDATYRFDSGGAWIG